MKKNKRDKIYELKLTLLHRHTTYPY